MVASQKTLPLPLRRPAPMAAELDVVPDRRLLSNPAVGSRADLDLALQWLSYFASRKQTVNARLNAQCDLYKQAAQQEMTIKVGRSDVPYAELERQLEDSVKAYVGKHRDDLFEAGSKTIELTFGKIAFRKLPARLEPLEGETEQSVLERIDAKLGLLKRLAELLLSLKKLIGLPAARCLRVEPALNKTALKAAFAEGAVDNAQLATIGLTVIDDQESLSITPTKYLVQTEAR